MDNSARGWKNRQLAIFRGSFAQFIVANDCSVWYSNVNIGHASPIGILALGIQYEIDLDQKKIRFAESATS